MSLEASNSEITLAKPMSPGSECLHVERKIIAKQCTG